MKEIVKSVLLTGNNGVEYNFSGEDANIVERSFNHAWERSLSHLILRLKGRTIILNVSHVTEVYINYEEVGE